jgi:cytochrome c oxidase subunit 1
MALTETRPETIADAPAVPLRPASTVDGLLGTGDHKVVGRMFLGLGAFFLLAGLATATVAALAGSGSDALVVDGVDYLPQVWSLGRDLILFGGLVPMLVGLGLYLVPLQVGAPSLAFPRGAAAALWTWLLGTGLVTLAYIFNGGPGGGRRDFVVLWAAALAMTLGGLAWAMVCIAITALSARTRGMTLERAPLTTWSFLVFSLVGLLSLPVLMAELLLAYMRIRYFHLPISESAQLSAVADGINLAPSIYWLGIPILGMAVDIIGAHTGHPVRMHRAIMGSIGLLGVLSFGVDLVGMASVRPIDFDNAVLVLGLAVAVLPVLATLAMAGDSIRSGSFVPRASMVGALVSGLLLLAATVVSLLGLVKPVMGFLDTLAPDSIDMTNTLILNGTRFHEGIRALVIGAVVCGLVAAVHHWSIKLGGRRMADPLAFLAVLAAAGGSVLWAIGEVAAGFDDQPWLPARATDDVIGLVVLSVAGAGLVAAAAAVLLAGLLPVIMGRRSAADEVPWAGLTLEWATDSPPAVGNFPSSPIVTSAAPLADGDLQYAATIDAPADGAVASE